VQASRLGASVPGKSVVENALYSATDKVRQYVLRQEMTLSQLFEALDTSGDGALQRKEFTEAMLALRINLNFKEIDALFVNLDVNGDNDISYAEFINQFADVNMHQVVQRVRRILDDSKTGIDDVVDPIMKGQKEMDLTAFQKVIGEFFKGLPMREAASVFAQFLAK
jgi:hypothetical protein